MNKFNNLDKFREILRIAESQTGRESITGAHPSTSEWDDNGIYLKDRYGALIVELKDPTMIEDLRATQPAITEQVVTTNSMEQSQPTRAARTVKRFLAVVEIFAVIFAVIVVLAGILIGSYVFQLNPSLQSAILSVFTIIVSLFIAALMYWSNRVVYSVLELFAEIAEDIRAIRLSSSAK